MWRFVEGLLRKMDEGFAKALGSANPWEAEA